MHVWGMIAECTSIYGMGVVNVCDLEPHGPLCVDVRGSAGWGSRVKATGSVRRYFEG